MFVGGKWISYPTKRDQLSGNWSHQWNGRKSAKKPDAASETLPPTYWHGYPISMGVELAPKCTWYAKPQSDSNTLFYYSSLLSIKGQYYSVCTY